MRTGICTCLVIVVCLISSIQSFAQQSASSASVSRSRAMANSSGNSSYRSPRTFVAPDEVAVEEFINYHRHRLPMPKAGESVAVDTRWGNPTVGLDQGAAILQIGFTTEFANERTDLRPLNLSLVIDKSGSMSDADKMSRVKSSLRTMIGQLRPADVVSIIVFDSGARVLCPAARVGDGYTLKRAIDSIHPGGSTNLHAGLMLGYKETRKNFRRDATNRVILLTDGIANVGTTEPLSIARDSLEFNDEGVDLSTIGVGLQLDRELLRTLSKQGRGLFHFVADAHDIQKVFVTEVQSLMSPVARRVNLEVDFDRGLELERVFGYEPIFGHNRVSIPLEDMNNGLTQLVLLKFRIGNNRDFGNGLRVRARLSYFDIEKQRMIEERRDAVLSFSRDRNADMLADSIVKKNYTIAELAQSLYDMTQAAKSKRYRQAEDYLNSAVRSAKERFPNMEDQDIRHILDIVTGFQRNLTAYNRQWDDPGRSSCGGC